MGCIIGHFTQPNVAHPASVTIAPSTTRGFGLRAHVLTKVKPRHTQGWGYTVICPCIPGGEISHATSVNLLSHLYQGGSCQRPTKNICTVWLRDWHKKWSNASSHLQHEGVTKVTGTKPLVIVVVSRKRTPLQQLYDSTKKNIRIYRDGKNEALEKRKHNRNGQRYVRVCMHQIGLTPSAAGKKERKKAQKRVQHRAAAATHL